MDASRVAGRLESRYMLFCGRPSTTPFRCPPRMTDTQLSALERGFVASGARCPRRASRGRRSTLICTIADTDAAKPCDGRIGHSTAPWTGSIVATGFASERERVEHLFMPSMRRCIRPVGSGAAVEIKMTKAALDTRCIPASVRNCTIVGADSLFHIGEANQNIALATNQLWIRHFLDTAMKERSRKNHGSLGRIFRDILQRPRGGRGMGILSTTVDMAQGAIEQVEAGGQ